MHAKLTLALALFGLIFSAAPGLCADALDFRITGASRAGEAWKSPATPVMRSGHSAIWTGKEMIIWGGDEFQPAPNQLSDGYRYDPASNRWRPLSTRGAPGHRTFHTAVWTGAEMIIWGGGGTFTGTGPKQSGGRYNPDIPRGWRPIRSKK